MSEEFGPLPKPRAYAFRTIDGDYLRSIPTEDSVLWEPLYDQAAVEMLVNQYADDERNQAELRWASKVNGLESQLHQMHAYAAQAVAAERERCANRQLTPQQLDKLIEGHVGGSELTDDEYGFMLLFARAVEQAHGIGHNP